MVTSTMEFLQFLFGIAEQPVYLCSLANEKNDPNEQSERHVSTRDSVDVTAFIKKMDRPKRGTFICVSTVRPSAARNKDNVSEFCFRHADIDFKDVAEDPDTILRRLKALRLPPSLIVASGNGYHCYWCFKEPIAATPESIEDHEASLKLLADMVGADQQVTQVAALMRVVGTHNSKRDEWKEVVVADFTGNRYEPDDLDEAVFETAPIVLRKLRAMPTPGVINPFLEAAKKLGFKPSIDVEKSLSLMLFGGGEDASIHNTQIRVSASLLEKGAAIEEVVTLLLDATRAAAGEYAERWNWKREEREIRKACATWLGKHPRAEEPKPEPVSVAAKPARPSATVHKLDDARKPKEPKPKSQKVVEEKKMHITIAQTVVSVLAEAGTPILVVGDQLWRYNDGIWTAPDNRGRHELDVQIETCIRALADVVSSNRLVIEVRGWILRDPEIHYDTIVWDDHGQIAVRGGLIHPVTQAFTPADPKQHVTARIDCEFVPGAACPTWSTMLAATFADRDEAVLADTIGLVQEVLGTALIEEKSKALSRALVIHGLSNTGKTDLIKTMSGLLTDRPISTPFSGLDGTHGLMEFVRKAPWVLHEAFNSGKWHLSDIVKSILSGDPVQINVKNSALITTRIRQPIFWGTNYPPQFKEASRAIINRMIVVTTSVVFEPKAPIGVAVLARQAGYSEPSELILATEKPGLLNWALEGLRRALERGHFKTTKEMDATLETIRSDANIVVGFLEECVSFEPSFMISTSDFCAAFSVWWGETKGEDRHAPSNESIGRALVAYGDPRVGVDRTVLRDKKGGYYAGVHLNSVGLDYWTAAEGANVKTARTSNSQSEVNRFLPPAWENFPVILRIKKNAEKAGAGSQLSSGEEPAPDLGEEDKTPRF
jgi:phage/plasmid-associated DNA primase